MEIQPVAMEGDRVAEAAAVSVPARLPRDLLEPHAERPSDPSRCSMKTSAVPAVTRAVEMGIPYHGLNARDLVRLTALEI